MTPSLAAPELKTLVFDVLAAEGRPATVTNIRRLIPKALPAGSEDVDGVVAGLADAGRLFRVGRRYTASFAGIAEASGAGCRRVARAPRLRTTFG